MSKQKPARPDSRRAQLRAAQIAEAKRRRNRNIAIVVVSALLVIALVVAVFLVVRKYNAAKTDTYPPHANAQRTAIRVNPDKAKQGAPVVTLFADYQCPACAAFEKAFGKSLDEMANNGDIQLEYHTMTFLDSMVRNDASSRAANAAACADLAGHYQSYHTTVFANQPEEEGAGYTDAQLTGQFAEQAGITGPDRDTFSKCYSEKKYSAFVKSTDQSAGEAGVTGTPALQVNGKSMDLKNLTPTDPNSLRTEIMKLK